MTIFNYIVLGAISLACLLTYGVNRRLKKEGGKRSFASSVFKFLGLSFTSILCIIPLFIALVWAYNLLAYPKYQATIVDIDSRLAEESYQTSNGNRRTRNTERYVPIVRFVDANGQAVTIETNVHRGSRPVIGDQITISYRGQGNRAFEVSYGNFLTMAGILIFATMPGLILLQVTFYVLGKERSGLTAIGSAYFFKFIVPGMILAPISALGILLGLALLGQRELSIIGYALSILFLPILAMCLIAYLRSDFFKNSGRAKSQA